MVGPRIRITIVDSLLQGIQELIDRIVKVSFDIQEANREYQYSIMNRVGSLYFVHKFITPIPLHQQSMHKCFDEAESYLSLISNTKSKVKICSS